MNRRLLIEVFVNLGAAAGCAIFAVAYTTEGFVAGEVPGPMPVSVKVFLLSMVLAPAVLGIVLSATLKHFPWVTVLGAPLLVTLAVAILFSPEGLLVGLAEGAIASVVFLLGALAARGFMHLAHARKPV